MTSPAELAQPRVTDAPLKIWLNYGDLARDCTHRECTYEEDVTWCEDNVFDSDVMYVRADVAEAQLLAAQADADRYRWLVQNRLHGVRHPIGDAWGMSEVIYGDDLNAAIDAQLSTSEPTP
jgi:hypothetical protein